MPNEDLATQKESRYIVYWVIISILGVSAFIGILGIVVEYSAFGNSTLSHEETNFANIDIPII